VTEELRTLLRSELGEERPPPLGDLVDVAMRDGRRIRRVRRLGMAGAGAAVLGVVALTATLAGPFGSPAAPVQPFPAAAPVQPFPAAPVQPVLPFPAAAPSGLGGGARAVPPVSALPQAPPLPVPVGGGPHALGPEAKATAGAMLVLLTKLLPPGKTSHYAVVADQDTHVQLYLDTGQGPGMIRAALEKDVTGRPVTKGQASISVDYLPDNCVQSIVVDAALPDGANLTITIADCLAWDGRQNQPAPPAITAGEAVKIAADPQWGLTMDAGLVAAGAKLFPHLPTMR
jgi:hypothetical protein